MSSWVSCSVPMTPECTGTASLGSSSPSGTWVMIRFVLFFMAAAGALFILLGPALRGSSLPIDDDSLINIPQLALPFGAKLLHQLFTPGNHVDFYPIRDLTYWIDIHVFGADTTGSEQVVYRIHNLLLLALSGASLYSMLNSLGAWKIAPWASTFWVFHPVHVESVIWASARKDLLSLMFGLLSAWAFIEWAKSKRTTILALAYIAFVGSLLSKTSLSLLPAAGMVWAVFSGRIRERHTQLCLFVFILTGLCASALQGWVYSVVNDMRLYYPMGYRIQSSAAALARMAGGWLNPSLNVLDLENWGEWRSLHSTWIFLGFLLWGVAFLGCLWAFVRKSIRGTVVGVGFWMGYLPISALVFPHRNFYSVRYFEACGLMLLIGLSLEIEVRCTSIASRFRRTAQFMGAAIILCAAVGTLHEAGIWESPLTVLEKSLAGTPSNVSLRYFKWVELTNIGRWGRLEASERYELSQLDEDLRQACMTKREVSGSGDLCWDYWNHAIQSGEMKMLSQALVQHLALLSPSSRERWYARFAFISARRGKSGISPSNAEAWLASNPTWATPELRVERWQALCAGGHRTEAKLYLKSILENGLLRKTDLMTGTEESRWMHVALNGGGQAEACAFPLR